MLYAVLGSCFLAAAGCSGGTPQPKHAADGSASMGDAASMDLADRYAIPEQELATRGFTSHWAAHPVPAISQAWFLLDNAYITRPGDPDGFLLEKIDGETGRLIWSIPIEGNLEHAPTVYRYPKELRDTNADELFFVQNLEAGGEYIFCVNDRIGDVAYRIECSFPVSTPPVAAQEFVYIGSLNYRLYCMSKRSKLMEWSYITEQPITATPEIGEDYVFAASEDNTLYAFNQGAGAMRGKSWKQPTGAKLLAQPIFHKSRIFAGSWDHKVYCFDLFQGFRRWSHSTGGRVVTPVFPFGQWVYAVTELNEQGDLAANRRGWSLIALEVADGKVKWESRGKRRVLAADGFHCFALDEGQRIHALSQDTGESRWTLDVGSWTFVLGQDAERGAAPEKFGRIYLANREGVLQCIRPRR